MSVGSRMTSGFNSHLSCTPKWSKRFETNTAGQQIFSETGKGLTCPKNTASQQALNKAKFKITDKSQVFLFRRPSHWAGRVTHRARHQVMPQCLWNQTHCSGQTVGNVTIILMFLRHVLNAQSSRKVISGRHTSLKSRVYYPIHCSPRIAAERQPGSNRAWK